MELSRRKKEKVSLSQVSIRKYSENEYSGFKILNHYLGEREYLIEELPTFYEYLGYLYYCGGTIAGPFFEYRDYINFMSRKGNYATIPSTIIPTLIRVSHAVCNLYAYNHYFSFDYC